MDRELLAKAKSLGFSDRQIAHLTQRTEEEIRAERQELGFLPGFRLVDTCAAEFEAYTPYYYSSHDRGDDEVSPSDTKKVMILGGGPNRIGQGIEFDYCCVHAAFALKEEGLESLMINSNPETVSTDYDTSDKLFFEPLTLEDVLHIYKREKCWGAIAQFGGQTPLNLALDLQANGVNIIGTSPQSIERAEDREMFADMLHKLDIPQPPNGLATNETEALEASARLSYPVLVRPSFVLGGRAMQIVYSDDELRHYMRTAVEASPERPVLVDKFLEDAIEVDVDCIADVGLHDDPADATVVIGGRLKSISSNARLGEGEYLVAEADESDGSFLNLMPTIAVVTNIAPEHLDHWSGGLPEIVDAFVNFVNKVPFYGCAVLCLDHPTVQASLPRIEKRYLTYGFSRQADY